MSRLDTLISHLEEDLFVRVEKHGAVGFLVMRHRAPFPANEAALTIEMRRSLLRGLRRLQADTAVHAIVLTSDSPRVFSSGVNRESFGDALITDTVRQIPSLAALCDVVEASAIPVVAFIQGSCSSWAVELAMACAHRIAFSNARFRFPEVELSLVPCGGGALRLTRLVGTRQALRMLCTGCSVAAREACRRGLVDTVLAGTGIITHHTPVAGDASVSATFKDATAPAAPSLMARVATLAEAFAAEAKATGRPPPRAGRSGSLGLVTANAVHLAWMRHKIREYAPRHVRAPYMCLRAIRLAVAHAADREVALAQERHLFVDCLTLPECAAMQHVLQSGDRTLAVWDRNVRSQLTASERALPFKHVAVIGAGTTGTALAFLLLQHGLRVTLVEVDPVRSDAANQRLEAEVMAAATAHQRMSVEAAVRVKARLAVLTCGKAAELPSEVAEADLVLECTPEVHESKRALFAELDRLCHPQCVFATSAASIGVVTLAAATQRGPRVIGLRFYPPANLNPLLEVSTLPRTGQAVLRRILALAERLQKHVVLTHDCIGHLGTRVLLAGLYQAYTMIEEGCFPSDVDHALRGTFYFKTGLLELEDMLGLDTTAMARKQLDVASQGPLGSPLMPRDVYGVVDGLVADGLVGRKRGEGWYRYKETTRASAEHDTRDDDDVFFNMPSLKAAWNPLTWRSGPALPPGQWQTLLAIRDVSTVRNRAVEHRALRVSKAKSLMRRDFEKDEICERIVLAMVNEAAKLLEAGVATCASDVDALSVLAYGFPAWKGGLLYYADHKLGVDLVIRRMRIFQNSVGADAFPSPCDALLMMSQKNQSFARAYPAARADGV